MTWTMDATQKIWRRRQILRGAAGLSGLSLIHPRFVNSAAARANEQPHFLLHVCISGGADATYLFDSRPLVFTDRGKHANYTYRTTGDVPPLADPVPRWYEAARGGATWRSPLTDPLVPYLGEMAICKGVHMGPQNGHGTNMYYLFSNTSAAGDSFMPVVGSTKNTPIEHVHIGGFEGDGNTQPTNFSRSIAMSAEQGLGLGKALVVSRHMDFDDPAMDYIRGRLAVHSQGQGKFSRGVEIMKESFDRAPLLASALNIDTDTSDPSRLAIAAPLNVAHAYFLGGVTTTFTVMLDFDPVIDTHSADAATNQVPLYQEIIANLKYLFGFMRRTEFKVGGGYSLMDLTTVMISSEFGRSNRQLDTNIDRTGTDHNQYSNTIILAGKGIKGGQVFGASDLDELDAQGEFQNVSAAHLSKDASMLMPMGKPFDVASGRVLDQKPAEFDQSHYFNMPTLTNTVMDLFGVPEDKWFALDGNKAPLLKALRQ